MTAQAQTANPTATLSALQDNARPLLVFAGSHDPRVEQQYAELADHSQAARERDIRIILLTKSLTKMHDGSQPPQSSVSPQVQQRLRTQFHIAPGEFAVLLLGKDGGEKLRSATPIPWQKLAATIDAMPMRQDELHHR